ncbi:MAG: hypothetical protein JNG88_07680 [Phycisphaerales bacterium]|nr:hypothetical protein [Phycisphaerales bacterium]
MQQRNSISGASGVRVVIAAAAFATGIFGGQSVLADSVNSPNIQLNVDTNRATGNGAGNVSVTINTITIAEITLPEYSAGAGQVITINPRPGFQFDPSSNITAQSATIGFNGGGINAVATVVPTGAADEVITFALTSGTNANVQDIIRINGVRIRIVDARGAAGPAQTTMQLTTSTAGGAFTNQGIVAANINRGVADHLVFSVQPGSTQSGSALLPAIRLVDFGDNIITNDPRLIALAIQDNPGGAALGGITAVTTANGVATWTAAENLNIVTAAAGYTLRASHSGAALQSADTADSSAFEITAGAPNRIAITTEPVSTAAGEDILIDVTVLDAADNVVSTPPLSLTLDAAVNPGGWPLLTSSSLTKETINGVASWGAADDLRINKAVQGYRLIASGVGDPVLSTQFDITPAAPALLRFVQQPSDTDVNAAIDPAPTVEVVDAFGNLTSAAIIVTLGLDPGSCAAALAGGAGNSIAGVATFAGLIVDAACNDTFLTASSSGLVGAVSDTFDVDAPANANDNSADNANDNADDNGEEPAAAACGLCGAGTALVFMPMLLAMIATKRIMSRRMRR